MNSTNSNILIVDKAFKAVLFLLSLLMPVFFLPITSEFFEFNKLALLVVADLILGLLWVAKLALGRKIELTKTSVDLPLLVFIAATAIATIFSVNKTVSIFGSQGRWFPGLFSLIAVVFYYYIAAPNLKDTKTIKQLMFFLTLGGTFSTLVSLLSYFGLYLGSANFMRIPNFSVTGSITTALILAGISLVTSLGLIAYEKSVPVKLVLVAEAGINLFFLAILNSPSGWIVTAAGVTGLLFMGTLKELISNKTISAILFSTLMSVALVCIVPSTRTLIVNKNYPVEMAMSFKESWIVATSTIRDYPLLATGPSTFYINSSKYRPLEANNTSAWNVRFDKPYNELLNVVATMGIIGLAAFLWLGTKVFKVALGSKQLNDTSGVAKVASSILLATSISMLVTFGTALSTFLIFTALALVAAAQAISKSDARHAELVEINFASIAAVTTIGEAGAIKKEYFHYVASAPMLALLGYAAFIFYKTYTAEYYIRQSVVAAQNNLGAKVYEFQAKAININPTRDSYHAAYAQTNLALANALASKPNLTDEDKSTVQTLISQAIRSSRIATEVLNPISVTNWQTRALVYRSIINVADNAEEWAIGSYNTAIQLDPTNPALRLDLGGIYFSKQDYLSAANYFRQATALKPDYANAHYNFAQALLKLNDPQNAKRELEITKTLIDQGSPDYQRVEQEIAGIAQAPTVAGAETQKPTVEQISGDISNIKSPQEPLTKPTEATPVIPEVPAN